MRPLALHTRRLGLSAIKLILALSTVSACAQDEGGSATQPVSRDGPWMEMHEMFLRRAERGGVDLLFLGDSITQGWHSNDVWRRFYGPRHAANFGIGGDRTQHVLWRLDHGEADKVRPKVVVLMIGTNNIGSNTADEIASGIKAIVERLRSKLPESRILLLGIFPRGANRDPKQSAAAPDPRVGEVNDRIARLDNGKAVKYLDIGRSFLDEGGKVPKDVMPDFLHLSERGYRLWADAMEPTLWEMVEGE